MKYFVQIFEKGEWENTLWTNRIIGDDVSSYPRPEAKSVSYSEAKSAWNFAKKEFPLYNYRIVAEPQKTIGNILQARYDEINARAQQYSLDFPNIGHVRAALNHEALGALEMLEAFKEAEKEHEENSDTVDLSALVRFLCTGEVGEAQALVEKFNTLFPSLVSVTKRAADAERDHRPATLGSSARRI